MSGLSALLLLTTLGACQAPVSGPPDVDPGLATLVVDVRGLASEVGQVGFALFDSEESFDAGSEPMRRAFLPITEGGCAWEVDNLPSGAYAVKVFHDLDGDGKLGYNFLGAPSEPYGFSNGARGRLGPPAFAKARFTLDPSGRRISVAVE